jgi:hypothetical protein
MAYILPLQNTAVSPRPVVQQTEWVRPADWITITDTPGEVQFLVSNLLLSAYTLTTTFTKPAAQNLYIDWGDGTTDTISTATSTNTSHTYTTAGTPCSRGYDTYKIRVYVDAGATITRCDQTKPATTTNPLVSVGVLEAYFGNGTISNPNNISFDSGTFVSITFPYLEYVKLPASYTTSGAMDAKFRNCNSLAKIVMPTSGSGITSCLRTFENCYALQSITFPNDATNITSLNGTLNNCVNLTGATFPSTMSLVTTTNTMFSGCRSLMSFQMPTFPNCTTYTSMFQNCGSLIYMNIPDFGSGISITTTSMFQSCASLQNVKFPNTMIGGSTFANASSMFQGCGSLQNVLLPTNFNVANAFGMFSSCFALSSVVLPSSMSLLTDMSFMFSSCASLESITLPTTIGASINMLQSFINCSALSSITIPSGYNITQLSNTFSGCFNLVSATLPTGAQNSLANINTAFNGCAKLVSVVLPSSMNAIPSLATIFQNCSSLTGATFPSTMNVCTTMNAAFSGCFNLRQVSLPTSMTSLTTIGLVNTFLNCNTLKSATLPATINASLSSYATTFSNCNSLETIILPTTQTTAITTISSMLNNCFNLRTITNTDKIGNPSTAATIYIDGSSFSTSAYEMTGTADFYCKFSLLQMNGTPTTQSKLTSLRLRNNGAGQYAGSSPQINISYTNLNQAALVQVFNDLPTITSKTINITAASGAAALTAPERAIATGKGWTIIG